MQDCIFCKIAKGEIAVPRIYEDEGYFCIRDIRPQAKVHLLVMPKEHVPSLDEAFPDGQGDRVKQIGELFRAAARVAREQGLLPGGYRTVINTGPNAGQTVFHIHVHLLGGEPLREGFA